MPEDIDRLSRELKHKIHLLEEENAQLSDKVADSLLFGLVSENLQNITKEIEVLENTLERVSVLKGISFATCGELVNNNLKPLASYCSFSDEVKIGYPISFKKPILTELKYGPTIVEEPNSVAFCFDGYPFKPSVIALIPFKSQTIEKGVFVFMDDDNAGDRLSPMMILLNQIVETAAVKYDNLLLLKALTQTNKDLECRVEQRTLDLARTNEILEKEIIERKESERLYRLLANNVSDTIWVVNLASLTFDYISPSVERSRGYTPEEAIAQNLDEAFSSRSYRIVMKILQEDLINDDQEDVSEHISRTFEVEQTTKSGSLIWVEITASLIRDEKGKPTAVMGVSRNISERKRVESEALAHAERFKIFFSSVNDSIFVHPLIEEGFAPFIEVNDIACARYGYSREEFLRLAAPDITKKPDVIEHGKRSHRSKLLTKGNLVFETVHIKKSGETFPVEVNSNIIYQFGDPFILAVVRDITERKQAEKALRESEAILVRSKKMESMGLLAGGVAHDLNNILSGIVSYPELILLDLPEDSKFRKPLETIQESGHRAAAIVQDLLTVARGVATPMGPLNLNDIIRDYLKSPEFGKLKQFHPTVTFKTNLDNDLFNVRGSNVHIRKAVMNLAANASEAIEGMGHVTISTMNRYTDKPLKGYDAVAEGEYVILSVADDGPGILADELERIFEPFYTRKVMGRSGTGLGLAVVWNVIQDHDGHIDVKTGETGTIFELYFPITRKEISSEGLPAPLTEYKGNKETILVVDDLESQRDIACYMLDTLGYEAKAISSGEEAVEYLKENTVDLILLDMVMEPGINGCETYERIIKIHPDQKAIIVSGFAETDDVKAAEKIGVGRYIRKPLTLERLGLAIKEELGDE